MEPMSLAAIAKFAVSTLTSYFAKKGLDKLLFSGAKFKDELYKTIHDTLKEYESKFPRKGEGKSKKFQFYHSQRIIDELLKFRVMHEGDYNPNDLLTAVQSESNVITPTIPDIENFYAIFLDKIAANETLKKLEIKETFDKKFEKFGISVRRLLEATTEVSEIALPDHISLILALKIVDQLQHFSVDDFVKDISFELPDQRELTKAIASILIEGSTELLLAELKEFAIRYNESQQLVEMIAVVLYFAGQYKEAVQLFRTFLDKDTKSIGLYYYIRALYETKQDSTELLQLLEQWRLKFSFEARFLKKELELRFELLDYKTCIEIGQYYRNRLPEDEVVLVYYAMALFYENTLSSNKELSKLVSILHDFEYKFATNVSKVATILNKRKFNHKAIELMYRYAKHKKNSVLRRQYFQSCEGGPLKELEKAELGSFVKYELDGKIYFVELTKENLQKDFYQAFLGAKKGGEVTVKQPLTDIENILSIQRVMNKYLYLHDEILEEVHNDPHNDIGMTSIASEENDVESLNETFKSFFGNKCSITNEDIRRYYDDELSFSDIIYSVFNDDYLGGYFQLVTHYNGLTSLPLSALKPEINEDAEYVLDITSLVLLFQIAKRHKVSFNTRFIISKFIVEHIKRKLDEQNSDLESELWLSTTHEPVTPHFVPKNHKEINKTYLNELLQWIDNNCRVEINTRVLDFTRNVAIPEDNRHFRDYLLTTCLFIEDTFNSILVTDDTHYFRSGIVPFGKIVTTEYLVKTLLKEDHPALMEFLKNRYQIYTPTLKQLNEEYHKKISGHPHHYDTCLHAINLLGSPGDIASVLDHIKEIALNLIIPPEKLKNDITTVFVNFLRGVNLSMKNKIKVVVENRFSLLGNKLDLIGYALKDAYAILDNSSLTIPPNFLHPINYLHLR